MSDALDHTLAHLARLDMLIRREILRMRLSSGEQAVDEFRGLYVSDEEVQALLALPGVPGGRAVPIASSDELTAIDRHLATMSARIDELEAGDGKSAGGLPLVRLTELFGLSRLERDTLVICLAAELDLKYERLYSYLQDDVTKKRPTVDLVMRLLCPSVRDRLDARRSFLPESALVRWHLLTLNEDPGARRSVLLARYLKLDERIAGYLLGANDVDSRLAPFLVTAGDARTAEIGPEVRARLVGWAEAWSATWSDTAPVVLFHGRYGTGRRSAAATLAGALGRPLLLLDMAGLAASETGLRLGLSLAEREALLAGAVLGLQNVDALLRPDSEQGEDEHRALVWELARGRVPTLLLGERAWEPARELGRRPFLRMELPEPTYAERHACWAAGLDGDRPELSDRELIELAGRFRLTPGQIEDALARARTVAWVRDPADGRLAAADIDAACRSQAQHRLAALARKLEPRYTWNDIVLPAPHLAALHLICTTVRHRPIVYGTWGFDRRLSLGKGLIALFSGPSGTGKTMAAEIIAHDLKLDLYKIDLSAVVSKYIGETEKNLERIFSEAQSSNAILFFDEADAIFGKRSEVKDAHDRYANIEISYLLQRMEAYDGVTILATNLRANLDEAFARRLQFAIDFPFPDDEYRQRIWQTLFPTAVPRASDLDFGLLARRFKLAGGNIRNIIVTATYLAAADPAVGGAASGSGSGAGANGGNGGANGKREVALRHILHGARRELQKMGRLVNEKDFSLPVPPPPPAEELI